MEINEKIKRITTLKPLIQYPMVETAKDFEELWDKIIKPSLPDKNIVVQWHNVLMNYVKLNNAIFTLRAYYTPSGNSPILRRGFLNSTVICGENSFETFYVDNSFPTYFYALAKGGYAPKNEIELYDILRKREIPCGFFQSGAEKELAAYIKGFNPGIGLKGYKLAHIFSAGENFDVASGYQTISSFCDSAFPRGERSEWEKNRTSTGEYYRLVSFDDYTEAEKIKKFSIAHFLRSVHPINYFLVPNKKNSRDKDSGIVKTNIYWHDYGSSGKELDEIGENTKLIEFVAAKIKDMYKDTNVYQEFLDLIYPIGSCINPIENNVKINARFSIGIWQEKIGSAPLVTKGGSSTKTSSSLKTMKVKYDEDKAYKIAAFYLKNSTNFIQMDEKFFGVTNQHGVKTWNILKALGIDTSKKSPHRGLLTKSDIDTEISKATGAFKETLEEIKKRRH